MKTSTTLERGAVTHFKVPAREMLFDQPECCPIYGGLTLDGLAIDENDGVHLIVRTTSARAYLGPELPVVARRAHILAAALADSGVIHTDRAGGVIAWLGECWTAAINEIAQAFALNCRATDQPPQLGPQPTKGVSPMIGTPWWGAALIGVLTVIGAGFAAWIGANRTTEATRQREHAAAREEWFRRMAVGGPNGAGGG